MATTTKTEFAQQWVEMSREWIPRAFARSLAGVSRQAIAKAIETNRLRVKRERFGDTLFEFVNLSDLIQIGGSRD